LKGSDRAGPEKNIDGLGKSWKFWSVKVWEPYELLL